MTVMLRSGVYHLSEPLVLEPEDSGTADRPIVYCAYHNETPEIAGGVEIRGWQPVPESRLWVTADVPKPLRDPLRLRQLFVSGQRRQMARRPHTGQFRMLGRGAGEGPDNRQGSGQLADGLSFCRRRFEGLARHLPGERCGLLQLGDAPCRFAASTCPPVRCTWPAERAGRLPSKVAASRITSKAREPCSTSPASGASTAVPDDFTTIQCRGRAAQAVDRGPHMRAVHRVSRQSRRRPLRRMDRLPGSQVSLRRLPAGSGWTL